MKSDLFCRFHIKDLAELFQPFYLTAQKLRVCNSAPDPLKMFRRLTQKLPALICDLCPMIQ